MLRNLSLVAASLTFATPDALDAYKTFSFRS